MVECGRRFSSGFGHRFSGTKEFPPSDKSVFDFHTAFLWCGAQFVQGICAQPLADRQPAAVGLTSSLYFRLIRMEEVSERGGEVHGNGHQASFKAGERHRGQVGFERRCVNPYLSWPGPTCPGGVGTIH